MPNTLANMLIYAYNMKCGRGRYVHICKLYSDALMIAHLPTFCQRGWLIFTTELHGSLITKVCRSENSNVAADLLTVRSADGRTYSLRYRRHTRSLKCSKWALKHWWNEGRNILTDARNTAIRIGHRIKGGEKWTFVQPALSCSRSWSSA